ncbi:hypothetical protein N7501_007322 [Penicillium viridicatum]|nr:hypothetical protein N7501_007322 [Penicillium viridicatum]
MPRMRTRGSPRKTPSTLNGLLNLLRLEPRGLYREGYTARTPVGICGCGQHETDPRAIDEPYLFEELWFTIKSPHSAIDETIVPFWMQLKEYEAKLERARQVRDREEAEDIARWVEEDRLEAEMLKQQTVERKDEE